MKFYFFVFFLVSVACKAQVDTANSCLELLKEIKTKKQTLNNNAKKIMSINSKWTLLASYDLVRDTLYVKNTAIEVLSKHKIVYITKEDKLLFKGEDKFKIIFGGNGPEKQTFNIIYFDDKCLILESTYTNKGFLNGRKVYNNKKTMRYLWKKK